MMVAPRDIAVGGRYLGTGKSRRWRLVRAIHDGEVEYIVEGVMTMTPMKAKLEDFAAWAVEQLRDETSI